MKQKQKKSIMYIFLEGAAALAAIMMLGIFPLYFQNNYIDMSNAKLNFFRVCSIGLVLAAIVFLGMDKLQQYKDGQQKKHNKKKAQAKKQDKQQMAKGEAVRTWLSGLSVTTWFAVIFVAGILVATIFSVNPRESFLGLEGRKLGAIVWLLCIAFYGLLGRYLSSRKWMIWVFLIGNMLVCLLANLNFWGVDPLGMYENLSSDQHGMFISTIGNVNACAGYLCMIVPVGMALYTLAKDKYIKITSGVFLVLGFCAGYCTHSESWLLGLAIGFLILLWFAMRDNGSMQKFLEVCGIFWISSVLMKIMMLIAAAREFLNYMYASFNADKVMNKIILNGYVLAAEGILIAGLLFLVWNRRKAGKVLPYRMMRKVVFIVVAVVVAAVVLIFAAANLHKGTWEGAFSALERLRMQDSWGSGRGYIWKTTVDSWFQLPLWDKIIGYGVNCYHMFINTYGGAEVLEFFDGAQLVDAHNELLQILTTMGILGTVGYFGLIISVLVKAAKSVTVKPAMLMGVVALFGYLAQALVNNPTVFLTPYLFLMLGMIKSMERMEDATE